MSDIEEHINKMFATLAMQGDEYINDADGLIYCTGCHTPRQRRVQIEGRMFLPTIMCRCQQESYAKEEAQRKHREFLMEVARMRASGLQDKALQDSNFNNDKGYNPELKKAHDYVAHWEEMRAKSLGLLLWGDVGTGKSFFAGCIANALLDKGVPVLMTNFSKILNKLTGMYSDDRNQFIDGLNKYSLLIIDDLGIERSSEFAVEQVFNVIDSRYRSRKPLIVTTNLPLDELKNPKDLAHARIYDRLLECCVPLKINNQNIRALNAAANMKEARKLLDSGT